MWVQTWRLSWLGWGRLSSWLLAYIVPVLWYSCTIDYTLLPAVCCLRMMAKSTLTPCFAICSRWTWSVELHFQHWLLKIRRRRCQMWDLNLMLAVYQSVVMPYPLYTFELQYTYCQKHTPSLLVILHTEGVFTTGLHWCSLVSGLQKLACVCSLLYDLLHSGAGEAEQTAASHSSDGSDLFCFATDSLRYTLRAIVGQLVWNLQNSSTSKQ